MNDEIKTILESSRKIIKSNRENGFDRIIMLGDDIDKLLDYITNLQEENQRLKELCDKYEEEHNTTFKLWTMKMEEMPTYEEKIEMQKENQRLKEELQQEKKDFKETNDYCFELKDYKSRCEKAIEHIKEHQLIYTSQYEEESNFDNHLLDILNGGDDNE